MIALGRASVRAVATRTHYCVSPPLDGPPTGGTLYNAHLLKALDREGVKAPRVSLEQAVALADRDAAVTFWVDSLFLDALPAVARLARGYVHLVAHYLPTLVASEIEGRPFAISEMERMGLEAARSIVVPSGWLRSVLRSVGVDPRRVIVAEPGVELTARLPTAEPRREGLHAVVVSNVVPGKGVLPLLEAVASELRESPFASLRITIVGSLEADAPYAARCQAVAANGLAGRVVFRGTCPAHDAQVEIAGADVFVSASRMESYGMALAEAVALGVPILAHRGGNVPAHVDERAGGTVFDDDAALARALVRLASAPAALRERTVKARAARRARSWEDTAKDFLDGAARFA
jgi:glycosyltransferase involved in cell wall biosynthesis